MAIGQEVAPPQGKCPANSTMRECGNRCEPKCGDPPGDKGCFKICDRPACACAKVDPPPKLICLYKID